MAQPGSDFLHRHAGGVEHGYAVAGEQRRGGVQFGTALSGAGVTAARVAHLADRRQPFGCERQAAQARQDFDQAAGQAVACQILRGERVVGGGQPVLEGEIECGRRLADARHAGKHEIGLGQPPGLQAVVGREAEIHRVHAGFVVGRHAVRVPGAGDGGASECGFDRRRQLLEHVEHRCAALAQRGPRRRVGERGKHQRIRRGGDP